MEARFVFSPLLIMLSIGIIVGFIGFILLFIKLLKSKPKFAALLLIVPVVLVLLGLMFFVNIRVPHSTSLITRPAIQQAVSFNSYPNSPSPIWSEGIENEFEADVYPSKTAAVRSIALKLNKEFRNIMPDSKMPETIVILVNPQELELADQLRDAIIKRYPEIKSRIVTNYSNSDVNEAYIDLDLAETQTTNVSQGFRNILQSGTFQASLSNQGKSTIIKVNYVDQPWVENFASFANSQPNKNYIVAKSNETSISPEDADWQAMNQAVNQVGSRLSRYLNPNTLEGKDIIASGILVDKFVQSFEGSSGKIWREAILLDVSQPKLQHLAVMISNTGRERAMDWMRMISSIVGLFILITIAYAFLNAATKGYYSLTLKIVGVILAAIFLFIILTLS